PRRGPPLRPWKPDERGAGALPRRGAGARAPPLPPGGAGEDPGGDGKEVGEVVRERGDGGETEQRARPPHAGASGPARVVPERAADPGQPDRAVVEGARPPGGPVHGGPPLRLLDGAV